MVNGRSNERSLGRFLRFCNLIFFFETQIQMKRISSWNGAWARQCGSAAVGQWGSGTVR